MLMVCVFARACVRARASARPSCLPVFEEIEIDERHRLNADRHPADSCPSQVRLVLSHGSDTFKGLGDSSSRRGTRGKIAAE